MLSSHPVLTDFSLTVMYSRVSRWAELCLAGDTVVERLEAHYIFGLFSFVIYLSRLEVRLPLTKKKKRLEVRFILVETG